MNDTQSSTATTLLLLTLLLTCGCSTVDGMLDKIARPGARLAGISLQDADLSSATLGLDIEVTNPYAVPLPLVDLDYSLASRGAAFLSGKAPLDGTVPARGKRSLTVPARLEFSSLLAAVQGLKPGAVFPYAAELGLSVDAPTLGALRLPLRKEGELPVPAAPTVSVREIAWDQVDLSRIAGTLQLDITNPNQFALDLAAIDYGLSLGGTRVASSSIREKVKLAASGGKGTVAIPLELSPGQVGVGLLSMLTGGGRSSSYAFDGALQVDTPFGPMKLPASGSGDAKLRSK